VRGLVAIVAAKMLHSRHLNCVLSVIRTLKMQNNYDVILREKNLLVAYTLAYSASFAADVLWTSVGRAR
jgi:hypothetical protein